MAVYNYKRKGELAIYDRCLLDSTRKMSRRRVFTVGIMRLDLEDRTVKRGRGRLQFVSKHDENCGCLNKVC